MKDGTVVVVGAGLAGSRCAEALRGGGFEGRILLVGAEPVEPYERPALSKELLAGEKSLGRIRLRASGFWAEHGIELLLGACVRRVDCATQNAVVDGGRTLRWDALVLATGARPRRLLGPHPLGVHVLRTLGDALALRRELGPGRRLSVIGAGFVGTEVASTATKLGAEVTLVDPGLLPFARTLGREAGELLRDRYRRHGVELRLGTGVGGFQAHGDGSLAAVRLTDGTEVQCDAALVAVGVEPAADLLGGGITTDAAGRTAVPGVYACGDVAATWRRSRQAHLRVEHWTDAARQGAAVARAILGEDAEPAEEPPYFWSDQFGLRLQCVGYPGGHERAELAGGHDSFRIDYLDREDRLVAALVANRPREVADLRRALAA